MGRSPDNRSRRSSDPCGTLESRELSDGDASLIEVGREGISIFRGSGDEIRSSTTWKDKGTEDCFAK
jgi:hypothetical protein